MCVCAVFKCSEALISDLPPDQGDLDGWCVLGEVARLLG